MKTYILLAGVNGAGKSTLYNSVNELNDIEKINADDIISSIGDWRNFADVVRGGKIAVRKIEACFTRGISFSQETTLCGKSVLTLINKAKTLGYRVVMYYVGVDSIEIAKARVHRRVQEGGHGIDDTLIERRYVESLKHLSLVVDKCDSIMLYDNTEVLRCFGYYKKGNLVLLDDIPLWFEKYMK